MSPVILEWPSISEEVFESLYHDFIAWSKKGERMTYRDFQRRFDGVVGCVPEDGPVERIFAQIRVGNGVAK